MDFFHIKERWNTKTGVIEIYPDFKVCRSKDLMVRGRSFYAIWDAERNMWSTDEYDVQRLVDEELDKYKERLLEKTHGQVQPKYMADFSTKSWAEFRNYVGHISDNAHQLDEHICFANDETTRKDYVSKKLPYPLTSGDIFSYDLLMSTLYDEEERHKLEWAIGAIISGDAKSIQKFIVLYGEAGAGKSTVLNIIQMLFDGYYTTFEAKALTSSSNAFATEVFKANPLVAIQHDGDLSKIEDNTKLNSIVSHEEMTMNEKYKPSYMARVNCFLFMGTNKPVKITDAKSGIIRRLIDVRPSGRKLSPRDYNAAMTKIKFELGAIASHCLDVYNAAGKHYYNSYKPLSMILQTDVFYNYVESCYDIFKSQDGCTLSQAYSLYKEYCDEALVEYKLAKYKFREELKNYFNIFEDVTRIDDKQVRSYYSGFQYEKFAQTPMELNRPKPQKPLSLVIDNTNSIFDKIAGGYIAQYATSKGTPTNKWDEVNTTLDELDTTQLHFVRLPENHIVIDFDLKDGGSKSLSKNLEAASLWPSTYAELSKSGAGVHLHYIYTGDPSELSRIYSDGIEIKVFTGKSSLRRKLSYCNNIDIATINSGLPLLKKGANVINFEAVKSEKALRALIEKNLRKEIHAGTKPSIDFIHKILEDAYSSGLKYDVTDMRPYILSFANNSSNQAQYCVSLVGKMQFKSDEESTPMASDSEELYFYDVEVFPNLFGVVYKPLGKPCVRLVNPTPQEIEEILNFNLIGFNNRRYDNHIMYARYLGYTNKELYNLSQKIINNSQNAMFGEAYNLSYTDIYDFSSVKQSLKKFEIELGIHHMELGLPWDEDVPDDMIDKVMEYCENDVIATEAVFQAIQEDWIARLILSELSGLSPNDTTQKHTAKIIFGNDPNPQSKFNYVQLAEMFDDYEYNNGTSTYRGEIVGEGGYVYSEPGMYSNVALIDVASMHPNSLINMNHFGIYTPKYKELMDARLAIKHKDFEKARTMMDGKLAKYLNDTNPQVAKNLSNALKIVINIVYGLTSAKFDNKFKDPRNIDNIVAKRGALFMIDLKHAVQAKGFTVAHIKTDSIKIPDATPEIIDFVMKFGEEYGYTFEHEDTYKRMCLVNDAVYIALTGRNEWSPTGAQFAEPYVYKKLFTKESIEFEDLCVTKSVTSSLYLNMNEETPDEDIYHFVGKVGSFCPIKPGKGGGLLMREKDGKYNAATGSKGYRWLEAEMVKELNKFDDIDMEYFNAMATAAISKIEEFGNFYEFVEENI